MTTRHNFTQKSFIMIALIILVGIFAGCNNDKLDNSKPFEFLGEAIGRPENFDKDTIVMPENIDSLYRQYTVEALLNGDYYLIRSKKSHTTSRYLSRLIQMKNGRQVAAQTFYDSDIDANAVIRLKNRIIVGLNSLRYNNYDSTFHMSTHKCRLIVLSDSLTPLVGKRFYSQRGHTYIESLMQNTDSTFFCSVASGDVELGPKARYQSKVRYNLYVESQTYITNYYDYEIMCEELNLSKRDWGNDLSDEEIAIARNEEQRRNRNDSLQTKKSLPERSDTIRTKPDSSTQIQVKKEPPVIVKIEHNEPVSKPLTQKKKFDNAKRGKDWNSMKQLADEGYSPAYLPLARHYMKNSRQHGLAKKYAEKAQRAGLSGAKEILNELEDLDF